MVIYELVVSLLFLNVVCYADGTTPHVKLSTSSSEACETRVSACEANPASGRRPVCGTDGRTYMSRCQLMKSQCSGDPVAVARKGACDEEQSSCLTSLRYALNERNGKRSTYIPRCRNDGTYAAVQCAAGGKTSGCWCVTPDGKPLPDTAATNGRPDCTRTGNCESRMPATDT